MLKSGVKNVMIKKRYDVNLKGDFKMVHQIKFTVGGIHYCINSDDDEAYIKSIANELEQKMDILAKKSPFLSTTMVAVLAALEAQDAAKKAGAEIERLRLQLKSAMEESAIAALEVSRLERELEKLRPQNDDFFDDDDEEF